MKTTKLIAITTSVACIVAGAAAAQNWQPPAEIAPKSAAAATPPSAAAPEQAPAARTVEAPKLAETPKSKEAKVKDCKAQSAAKGLHGQERKKFLAECKNS
jgi:hypothetical protein